MADNRITAEVRTEFGKGAARRTRRENKIPAVLYGHGTDPVHLALPSHDTFVILKDNQNALLTLDIDGEEQLALTKDIQLHPVRRTIEHVDVIIVRRGEKVTVDVPLTAVGETEPGTIHTFELQTMSITVPATSIPEVIEVSIDGLDDGDQIKVSEVPLPAGAVAEDDPEALVVAVSIPRIEEEPEEETEGEEGVEGEEGAEGEGAEGAEDGDSEGSDDEE